MKRDYKLYLNDIKKCITQIERYVKNVSQESFEKNILLQDAVIRRLEIIGEASRSVPRSLKAKNKQVPWFQMEQFRDVIVHGYYEVSPKRVWRAATEEITLIKEAMNKITLV